MQGADVVALGYRVQSLVKTWLSEKLGRGQSAPRVCLGASRGQRPAQSRALAEMLFDKVRPADRLPGLARRFAMLGGFFAGRGMPGKANVDEADKLGSGILA